MNFHKKLRFQEISCVNIAYVKNNKYEKSYLKYQQPEKFLMEKKLQKITHFIFFKGRKENHAFLEKGE